MNRGPRSVWIPFSGLPILGASVLAIYGHTTCHCDGLARYLQYMYCMITCRTTYSVQYKNEAHAEFVQDMPENHANIHPKNTYININHIEPKKKKHRYINSVIHLYQGFCLLLPTEELLTDSVTGRGCSVARAALNHKDKTKGNKHTNAAPEVNLLLGSPM